MTEPAQELLPYAIHHGDQGPRVVTRVAGQVIDLARLADDGILSHTDPALLATSTLNPLIAAGVDAWVGLRSELIDLVTTGHELPGLAAVQSSGAVETVDGADETQAGLALPVAVADYVDFYSSVEHATNLGRLFRPDGEPLLPNWRHLPIGYHGRAGTVMVSGTPITRPLGQTKGPDDEGPTFGPTRRLDIELELGAILAGSPSGAPFADPNDHLFGLVLVNDWSARDIQAWEYQPLGPFLGKSFATTISAWVIPWLALDAYRVSAPHQTPAPLPYLDIENRYNLNIDLAVEIRPAGDRRWFPVSQVNASGLYWTFAQQVAHLRSNGATIRSGDLIATGTISGPERGTEGSFIERTLGGAEPLVLANGEQRDFLIDGDSIRLTGRLVCADGSPGPPIGSCEGTISPAPSFPTRRS